VHHFQRQVEVDNDGIGMVELAGGGIVCQWPLVNVEIMHYVECLYSLDCCENCGCREIH
jgi:hypothetical protein